MTTETQGPLGFCRDVAVMSGAGLSEGIGKAFLSGRMSADESGRSEKKVNAQTSLSPLFHINKKK